MNPYMTIGYQASHEQFTPGNLLEYVQLAEKCGFKAINSSDHFYPWSKRQGQSGFAFAWLGAAMQATALPYGSVCAPGQRYHPAIIAQAIATLGQLFPNRYWIALGSGEALNERITGERWPMKADRQTRLLECVQIIRKLLQGETVTHRGSVVVEEAKLYTLPDVIPPLFGAAVTKETAAFVGGWADGMITVHQPYEQLKEVVNAFRNNGGEGKPVYLKVQLSFAKTEEEAMQGAYDQWRTNIFTSTVLGELWQVEQFDMMGDYVKKEDVAKMVRISSDVQKHIDWINQDMELNFEKIILHNVNREQRYFIEEFGSKVLPHFS